MIAPNLDAIPKFLTDLPRWLAWRLESRGGKSTKAPKTLRNTAASSTNPRTWAPFAAVAAGLERQPRLFDGAGIVLGKIGNDEHLCGVDLDSCINEEGMLAEWAKPFVAALQTYGETSPGERGLKFIFRCRLEDARDVRVAFGITGEAWGCKRSIVANGAAHGPAIEIYLGGGRYFTITGKQWLSTPDDVALLDRATLLRLAEVLPKLSGRNTSANGTSADTSRSAVAFREGTALIRQGKSYDEMCAALRSGPETAEWCREKGDAHGGRELRRIWMHAAPHCEHRLPIIRVAGGKRHEAADAGLDAITAAGVPFYQRDRNLVRVCAIKAKASDGTVVHVPAVTLVAAPMLGRALGQSAQWESVNRKGEINRIDPPKEVVDQIGAMIGEWPFPPLYGVIGTPTLRPDGSLLTTEGYDPATGLVLFAPPSMPPIAPEPTKRDALEALALLNTLLLEFPFANDASRSVAMSMLLTPVLRGALPPAVPLHCITAPEAGTGKSYLEDIASCIATGDRCAVLSIAKDPNETEKRLIGAALAQQPIIALDNVSELLMGDFLCQATERPLLQIRPLGTSNLVRIANSFTTFANGNNLTVGADVVRRTIQCALDANMEAPEARQFTANPVAMVLANRGRFIAACLTIARAYIVAGRPGRLPSRASYEGWSDTVRSALTWLNWPDPVDTISNVQAEDPVRQQRAAIFSAWTQELMPFVGFHTGELIRLAEQFDGMVRANPQLWDALYAVAAPRSGIQQIDPKQLGKWLSRNVDTIAGGQRLTVDRTDSARPRWKLTRT